MIHVFNYSLVVRYGALSFKSGWPALAKRKSKPPNEQASEIISVGFSLFKKKKKSRILSALVMSYVYL